MSVLEGFRLSSQQERLWPELAGGGLGAVATVEITGPLDRAAFRRAVRELVERHDVLATVYRCLPGMEVPIQVILEERRASLEEIEEDDEDDSLRRELLDGLDVDAGPVAGFVLVGRGPGCHRLHVALAAPAGDAATLDALVEELAALHAGEAVEDAEELLQYVQFSEWQQDALDGEDEDVDAGEGHAFWREERLGELHPPALPGELAAVEDDVGGRFTPAVHRRELAAVAYDGVAKETVLLAAWQILLARLSADGPGAPVTVEVETDGRSFEELEGVPGGFAQSLPVASRFTGDLTFA